VQAHRGDGVCCHTPTCPFGALWPMPHMQDLQSFHDPYRRPLPVEGAVDGEDEELLVVLLRDLGVPSPVPLPMGPCGPVTQGSLRGLATRCTECIAVFSPAVALLDLEASRIKPTVTVTSRRNHDVMPHYLGQGLVALVVVPIVPAHPTAGLGSNKYVNVHHIHFSPVLAITDANAARAFDHLEPLGRFSAAE